MRCCYRGETEAAKHDDDEEVEEVSVFAVLLGVWVCHCVFFKQNVLKASLMGFES